MVGDPYRLKWGGGPGGGPLDASRLPDPGRISEGNAFTSLAEIQAQVVETNERASDIEGSDITEKLKKWLEKIYEGLHRIAEVLSEHVSFTVTVGSPFAVNLSVTFDLAAP